jgi:hypothetical protein
MIEKMKVEEECGDETDTLTSAQTEHNTDTLYTGTYARTHSTRSHTHTNTHTYPPHTHNTHTHTVTRTHTRTHTHTQHTPWLLFYRCFT